MYRLEARLLRVEPVSPLNGKVIQRTCEMHDAEIFRTIEIVDVSGTSVLKSPEMRELMRLMDSPEIAGVVTAEFSRLMRPEDFTDYCLLQHFVDTRSILYLPDGPIDLASDSGALLGLMRAAMAGHDRRVIIRRMQNAKEVLRRSGKHPGGQETLSFGVGYSKSNGWFYTGEIEKVKQAFKMFLSGFTSYTEIGRRLNIPRTSVRYLLQNPQGG